MKKKCIGTIALILVLTATIFAQNTESEIAINNYNRYYTDGQKAKDLKKEESILNYRQQYQINGYRTPPTTKTSWEECILLLNEAGQFTDLKLREQMIFDKKMFQSTNSSDQNKVADVVVEAYDRIWEIAEAYRKGQINEKAALTDKYLKAITHYGKLEISRSNKAPRFHASCFAMPTAAVNIYFAFLKQMDNTESGKDDQFKEACIILKAVALQCWTQPFRNDETDKNVVQIDRFRSNVWWVGGNALAYRPLLPVAFMYRSIPMIDLISQVSQNGISMTSQNTFTKAFWTEGFTVDGAGWGHGKQGLVWGYPIDGTSSALAILGGLKGSPWAKKLTRENTDALLNFFRGSNWYYYDGFILPCLDRGSMLYDIEGKPIKYLNMLESILNNWKESLTNEEYNELKQLAQEAKTYNINMKNFAGGVYDGTRWFFNNDDLIKKNENYHIIVNMASIRCDGLESAADFADSYNFFTADGLTLFHKKGDEYRKIMGGWDITAAPGITAREGMDKLTPVTNWRGYCSKYNFAGAATNGGENAVAGFIFEKMNASEKDNVNDKGSSIKKNPTLYGVKAFKASFMLGDYFVALGAGINNLNPEMDASIRTTIDQTAHENEVTITENGKSHMAGPGVQSFMANGKPVWVTQKNKFSYTILPEFTKNAFFVCENKKTDWIKMNMTNEKNQNLPDSAAILRLWVDHGQRVTNGTYGYVVYAGKGIPSQKLPFHIMRNDSLIQAVESIDHTLIEAVFYKANTQLTKDKISLTASVPCVVLIEDKGKEYAISVTDPTMDASLKQINLVFNGKNILVDMPQDEYCGKPAVIKNQK